MSPATLYDIRSGMTGQTVEWGHITVLRNPGNGRVTIRGRGGRGPEGYFETTRSILFAATQWTKSSPEGETE